MNDRILLINPPWHRNSEPPLGLGLIQAFIQKYSKNCPKTEIFDLNAEAAWILPSLAREDGSTRIHRAIMHQNRVLLELSTPSGFSDYSKYIQLMTYYSDLVSVTARNKAEWITAGDYQDQQFHDFGPETVNTIFNHSKVDCVFNCLDQIVENKINQFKPGCIGISLTYRSQFLPGLRLASKLQKHSGSHSRIMIGGSFCSCLSEETLNQIRSENIVIHTGKGEHVFLTDAIQSTHRIPFLYPDFSGIEFNKYFSPIPVIPLISSRGCYWGKCRFCDECKEKFYMCSQSALDTMIEKAEKDVPGAIIHFTDNAIPPVVLKHLASRKKSNLSWYGFVRATKELTDPDFVKQLYQSGCKMLQIGFETPVARLLKDMGKGIDPETYGLILDNLRHAGIRSYAYLMFGYPGQNLDDNNETIEFLRRVPVDFLNASIFRLAPGSPLAVREQCIGSRASKASRDPNRLYLHHPDDVIPLHHLRRWISQEFQSTPVVRHMIQKTPRFYKSSHAVFF